MAKPFKRLTIPLTENSALAIQKLAEAKNASLASTISDYLDESSTQILILAEAIEAAKTNPELALKMIQEMAAKAQKDIAEEQLDLLRRG